MKVKACVQSKKGKQEITHRSDERERNLGETHVIELHSITSIVRFLYYLFAVYTIYSSSILSQVQIIHIVMMSPPVHTVGMDVDEINATQDRQRRTADYS
ncbi:unnamed protein product [Arabis nemorensis]|uniref:Uncharacterized protein n=1 Tax=Arabis nemorensis TaxID=586526 RepID=A0A565AX33_9BRAS|nr:unnamed protein product [Arabis nemorensis]